MINDKVDPFVNQYRDALERQRDLSFQNLDNTRRNDFAGIMGAANTAGMMYSNFPQRSKIQYDTSTYMPNQAKIQNTYQTGLDKLRSNVVNLSNQLKNVNDAISDLNKTGGSNGGSNTRKVSYNGTTYEMTGTPKKNNDGTWTWGMADGKGQMVILPDEAKKLGLE